MLQELIKGLKEIHVSYIDKEEIDQLSQVSLVKISISIEERNAVQLGQVESGRDSQ